MSAICSPVQWRFAPEARSWVPRIYFRIYVRAVSNQELRHRIISKLRRNKKRRIALLIAAVYQVVAILHHRGDTFEVLRFGARGCFCRCLISRQQSTFGEVLTAQSDQLFLVREVAEDALVKCGGFVGFAKFAI